MDILDTPAAPVPAIPGYTTSRQLGQGGSSTVWLAARDRDGAKFAVKCVRAEMMDSVRREAGLLSGIKHEHLVRIHDVVQVGDAAEGTLGIVMDFAAGGSLANLMAGQKRLGVGEAVTVLTPVAQALAYLHSRGVVHGDVSPGNVLFTALGKPLLADMGVGARVGDEPEASVAGTEGFEDRTPGVRGYGASEGQELQPHRDVYALAAVGWYCLTGSAPGRAEGRPPLSLLVPDVPKGLVAALEAGLDPDPRARPSASELGTAIFRSAAPEPLDLAGAVHSSVIPELLTRRQAQGRSRGTAWQLAGWLRVLRLRVRPTSRSELRRLPGAARRRRSLVPRRAGLAVIAGVLIGALAWNVWQQNRVPAANSRPPAANSTSAAVEESAKLPEGLAQDVRSEDPTIAVAALSAARDAALAQGHPELLGLVNAAGSPAALADSRLREQLHQDAMVLTGFSTTLSGLTVQESNPADDVLVAVTATTSAYEERLASGAVVRTVEAGAPQQLRLHVVRVEGRWWISDILGP
ncbi:protein kinase [Paenarthrobacter sp. NPDC056912]|uniref:protein kinase domain-containing protein n=1 Tax=Paenarthrobacter sp. NPDC056912 TaxID=3345965 RepID=UPI00366CDE5D